MTMVSVIIPSYNHALYIGKAVQSVLDQTYTDYEVLISDDCSTDDTLKVLQKYMCDPRITLFVQEKHLGAVEQIHYLVQKAQGKYIALLNSDDLWLPEKLQKQVAYMEEHPSVGVCFTQARMVDQHDLLISKEQFPLCDIFLQPNRSREEWLSFFLTKGNALAHPSILARRGLYEGKYRLNPGLRQLPDFDLWTRYLQDNNIYVFQETLTLHRRVNSSNTSAQTDANTRMLYREQGWIRRRLIENMSERDFQSIFSEQLREKACSNVQVLCEKFFVLEQLGKTDAVLREQAIDFYLHHAYDPPFIHCLREKYNYSDFDFFVLTQKSQLVESLHFPHTSQKTLWRHMLSSIYSRLKKAKVSIEKSIS